ncbi:hypothetical protein FACS1894206_04340 [Deltaproteobacteria bacterium]|nr:hypothetical protein FACS1894206_04340 [Deltaproteobacteria bacterium]
MKRLLLLIFILTPVFAPYAFAAETRGSLTVTPLSDDSGPARVTNPAGAETAPAAPQTNGTPPRVNNPASSPAYSALPESSNKDGITMAYLIEMARKQNKPCPSGENPPIPPSLTFSEPLCRVADAVGKGADFQTSLAKQGLNATKWRRFSAADMPAQRVIENLQASHCEALREPYTHVGAVRDARGWNIVLATLADKPAQEAPLPGEAAAAALLGAAPSSPADNGSQYPRELFISLNDARNKGGSCLGKVQSAVPALAFDPILQMMAEQDAVDMARNADKGKAALAGTGQYPGTGISKLTMRGKISPSAVLETWLLNANYCATLFSPLFVDAGVAQVNGNWVLILGEKGKGVTSTEKKTKPN